MKKTLFILILVICFAITTKSQISIDNIKQDLTTTKSAGQTGLDVKSVTSGVMSKLTSSLALTDVQKPKVQSAVTSFLENKSSILSLASTDKTQYTSKLSGFTSGLTTKLKGILTASQYTKFLSLKPSKASSTDVLSQLFY